MLLSCKSASLVTENCAFQPIRPLRETKFINVKSVAGPVALTKGIRVQSRKKKNRKSSGRMFSSIRSSFQKESEPLSNSKQEISIGGTILLQRKRIIDLNDQVASIRDKFSELVGDKVQFQLVSLDAEPATETGTVSEKAELQNWNSKHASLLADEGTHYSVSFSLDRDFGTPGAILVTNEHHDEFFLESLTLEMPDRSQIHFPCNSWVYNSSKYDGPRIFFSNQVYLPRKTPSGLKALREAELKQLQGNGTGERVKSDRIYDYDVYNDLGDPDKGEEYARPVLGGSKEYPYPRRCRTGRERTQADPAVEKQVSLLELVYIPRDEIFDHIKTSDFIASAIKSVSHILLPAIEDLYKGRKQFSSFKEVNDLYAKGVDQLSASLFKFFPQKEEREDFKSRFELIRELTDKDTEDSSLLKFPLPQVIQESKDAWSSDEEFARQMLGGMHPIVIERLKVFPPASQLDPQVYGPPTSSITAQHIEGNLEGLSVEEALEQNKLYTLDYHDAFLPYLAKINALEDHKTYASRTILFLTKEGTLKPVAIELSLPPPAAGGHRIDRVFVPPPSGQEDWLWRLAKTHAILNDTPVHQLVSHFVRTHATVEPFIIASHRQLSAIHPLFVLLHPHFKNTMNINAIARKVLLNADTGQLIIGGIIERTFTAGKYAMELSSVFYKQWRFDEQGLPADLIKRGMAMEDKGAKHGVRLLIEDYPYAVDGLEVWGAIEGWVREYVGIYYKGDEDVREDMELQRWWAEVKEVGHGDKKDESWWVAMHTPPQLVHVLTTLIWLASAHHAAVNFGQFPFAGFMPLRPTLGRRLIPSPGSPAHASLLADPASFLFQTLPSPPQTTLGLATIEILSTHAADEEYLGQRPTPRWTGDPAVLRAFARFGERLARVEDGINERNRDASLKNRYGEVRVPYTLLLPSSKEGITGRGIPNSTSI